ncbi:hypothetical protein ACFQ1L_33765 [Phytohabitans flavus]|uniref:hypothetical protein n=1 Tax=Phytohabitans flavus TaxID=1076124 RepID=UPI001564C13A|nr:hypothetical protein [Phytohabitans flavus]
MHAQAVDNACRQRTTDPAAAGKEWHMHSVSDPTTRQPTSRPRRKRSLQWLARLVVAFGLLVTSATVVAAPASAYVGSNVLRNHQTGRCLTFIKNGIYTEPCNRADPNQIWQPLFQFKLGNDIVILWNPRHRVCVYPYGWLSGKNRGEVNVGRKQSECAAGRRGFWEARGTGWHSVNFVTYLPPYPCLDSNYAGDAYYYPCIAGNRHQMWKLGL